jgi:Ca2+-binding RTX toxin-like protein
MIRINGYTSDQVRFLALRRSSDDLIIRFVGTDDAITVLNGLSGSAADMIERVEIVDSALFLDLPAIAARLLLDRAADGADVIGGTAGEDRLTGGPGPDALDGRGGDDIYECRRGDGDDRIEKAGADAGDRPALTDLTEADLASIRRSPPDGSDLILDFGSGDLVTLVGALDQAAGGVDIMAFASGAEWTLDRLRSEAMDSADTPANDRIRSFSSADTLRAKAGVDSLFGRGGGDTCIYAKGGERDVIEDNGMSAGVDALAPVDDVAAETSVQRFYRGDDGTVPSFAGIPGDRSVILNTLGRSDEDRIEEIRFADGVVWTMFDVLAPLDNNAPIARQDGFFSVVRGEASVILASDLTQNDFDPDGAPLTVISVSNPEFGAVKLNGQGNVVFTADPGHAGVASFDHTVSDGSDGSDGRNGRDGLHGAAVHLQVRPPASALMTAR